MKPATFSGSALLVAFAWAIAAASAVATPANKAALERHFDRHLGAGLNRCTTCHLPSPVKDPESLEDFPHNPFGDRLRIVGDELEAAGKRREIAARLTLVAREDADGDGVDNEAELLSGTNPGDGQAMPSTAQLSEVDQRRAAFATALASYRWRPFEHVTRPKLPPVKNAGWTRNALDYFVGAAHDEHGLIARPAAAKEILLRRVYLDLIGLPPTPDEQRAFHDDNSPDAYERLVDRLLADPRYGERWGRHWMDIWRYSDWAGWTDGKQVRDSQRHIWRWRDWIVESLNAGKGYDRMVMEMLAADELAPDDAHALRATGFLARNYKMLSREQWLEDTVKHTAQAFMGITIGCAKCHDHRAEPISQAEYYQFRAIFEPHQVRIDRVPGELDREKDGLPRAYDADAAAPTYFLIRGDERSPDKERLMQPGFPKVLSGDRLKPVLEIHPRTLPREATSPDTRPFVIRATVEASERQMEVARKTLNEAKSEAPPHAGKLKRSELELAVAEANHEALLAVLRVEELELGGGKSNDAWTEAATKASRLQLAAALAGARVSLHKAEAAEEALRKPTASEPAAGKDKPVDAKALAKAVEALDKARKDLTDAEAAAGREPTTSYKPREKQEFPNTSTGRRLALAKWLTDADHPLTARVAVNHIWLRHFGRGIATTPENLGTDGARPSHPALLDWLAAELISRGWQMKPIHRLIVTSATYRMASTPDEANRQIDPDNVFLWRAPSRRIEAELVRDGLLFAAGNLDLSMGGPEVDHKEGLTSKRRSIYLRSAAEKQVEFLNIFDGPGITECYQRHTTVMPQQSLALGNSQIAIEQSKALAKRVTAECGDDDAAFVERLFRRTIARGATPQELQECVDFLHGNAAGQRNSGFVPVANTPAVAAPKARARENLALILFNHHEFVTAR
jgi:hypothetical protein